MATVETRKSVVSLAVSKDRRWIAAGTGWGDVFVWNAETYEKVFWHRLTEGYRNIHGVDFSPDSSRLVSASHNQTAIWDIATCKRLQTLDHGDWVRAAKYSPQGDRIATATVNSVRVYDSNDGRLLMDTPVKVAPWFNTGLLWFNNHLFVISDSKIKRIEASSGSAVSEWPVPESTHFSCITLPKHGEFIAYSTQRTITFWDTATHTARSHPTPSRHMFDRSLTRRPASRNWWRRRENHHQ
jgi:WD40 repeat protein